MTGSRGDDPAPDAEIDRRFADLVRSFYDESSGGSSAEAVRVRPADPEPRPDWVAEHPLFQLTPTAPEPEPADPEDAYVPDPVGPLPRLSRPALVGALMLSASVLVGLLALLGLPFPMWVGWLTISGFTLGMIILLSRLPRTRDESDGDGAVL